MAYVRPLVEPRRLRPDNFTPATRTPWGGRALPDRYKRHLDLGIPDGQPIGESWEISVEPSFPSLLDSGERLADVIAEDPVRWLGAAVAETYGGQLPLLVKLVDAADKLSVQVHPPLRHPALGPDESGKLEAWLVLDAAAGAGVYLGFQEGVTRRRVEDCLASAGRLDELMSFVPVAPGDVYVIRPGTPHCLMGGITVAEPQLVVPDKKAITYRFWDWNRLYDRDGRPSASGRSRELHVERSLDVTDWAGPQGAALVESLRPHPERLPAPFERLRLVAEGGLEMESWRGTGTAPLAPRSLVALTCLEGRVDAGSAGSGGGASVLALRQGESAVIPAAAEEISLHLDEAYVLLSTVVVPGH
jgi:mannose-6-phosphate isomerase